MAKMLLLSAFATMFFGIDLPIATIFFPLFNALVPPAHAYLLP
jgi:hypothetical protein